MYKYLLTAAATTLVLCSSAYSNEHEAPPPASAISAYVKTQQPTENVVIGNAWVRAAAASGNSAAYFIIENKSTQDIILDSVSAGKLASSCELHTTSTDDKGISRMTSVSQLIVPANSAVAFKPGGLHVMLMNLTEALVVDQEPITILLHTKDDTTIPVKLDVQKYNPYPAQIEKPVEEKPKAEKHDE